MTAAERSFLREATPWGLIIFKRNVSTPEQVQDLVLEFRDCLGWKAPVLVDQEGGRVKAGSAASGRLSGWRPLRRTL